MTGFQQVFVWTVGIVCTLGTVVLVSFFALLVRSDRDLFYSRSGQEKK